MAKFTLYSGRKKLGKFNFDKGPIRIGRDPDSEIFLDHEAVSRNHAVVKLDGNTWSIENAAGKNGLFINGAFTPFQILKNGDSIEISRYVIRFSESAEHRDVQKRRESGEHAVTHFRSMEEVMDQIEPEEVDDVDNDEESVLSATGAEKNQSTMMVSMDDIERIHRQSVESMQAHLAWFDKENKKKTLVLDKEEILIGKTEACAIQVSIAMPKVKEVGKIRPVDGKFAIEPLSRWVGIKVNNGGIKGLTPLKDGDKIMVQGLSILFHDQVS